jgi:hypothetical protein
VHRVETAKSAGLDGADRLQIISLLVAECLLLDRVQLGVEGGESVSHFLPVCAFCVLLCLEFRLCLVDGRLFL